MIELKTFPIVTVADSKYLPSAQFLLQSVLNNYHREEKLKFYIVHYSADISDKEKDDFLLYFAHKNVDVYFVTSPNLESESTVEAFERYKTKFYSYMDNFSYDYKMLPHWKSFIKMWIHDAVPENKILFLDSDTFVFKDIDNVFNYKVNTNFSATLDTWPSSWTQHQWAGSNDEFKLFNTDHLTNNGQYRSDFNSGVFITNLDYWRENKFHELTIEYMEKYIVMYTDQDILNYLFLNNYTVMPLQFNTHYKLFISSGHLIFYDRDPGAPAIIHFCSNFKPIFKEFKNYNLYDGAGPVNVLPTEYVNNHVWTEYNKLRRRVVIEELYHDILKQNYSDINQDEVSVFVNNGLSIDRIALNLKTKIVKK